MPDELPSRVIASIAFVGRSGGQVKTLSGFNKRHHNLPDTANAVTNGFLGKIAAAELADEAERLFQALRVALNYKRKDISLSVASPLATLTAKDFTFEIGYALEEREPTRYAVTSTLRDLRDAKVARLEEFSRVFAGAFSELSFLLGKGARVEAVVDAIEGLQDSGLRVDYPSDCRDCTIRVDGVEADVRCTGATLDVIFSRGGAPAELIDAFVNVRQAFQGSRLLRELIE
jgi:hypothetical protein